MRPPRLLTALLLLLLSGCGSTVAPMRDASIERGTALPPPGLPEQPRR